MADQASLRELGPSPEGPLAGEHNPILSPRILSLIVQPTVLARTMMCQLKHAMNSVGDEIHRFALPKGATQTAIKTRIEMVTAISDEQ